MSLSRPLAIALTSVALAAIALAGPAAAGEIPVWSPNDIEWKIDRPGGTKLTVLEGDFQTPGKVLTYAFKMPDGAWYPAHTHPSTARVFVLKGVLLLGEGASSDKAKARRVVAGEAALVPGGLPHFEGAEGETVIIGVATGPWGTTFLEPVTK